ncbi:MAG: sensor c-di-GMP phosphodiesterase-like protein [Pseudomonadales bacterium]|jgi:sensor c-di-GMP phosphodiesterase-like protein
MRSQRSKILIGILAASLLGVLLLLFLGRYLWKNSVLIEEQRLEAFSFELGQQAENAIIDARDLLAQLNNSSLSPCSPKHIQLMQESAVARPYIRAIGYWIAAERQCGAGFIQGIEFTPPRASRIYDSGVIAWWPSKETEVGGIELFLMRFGEHDVVIDPRLVISSELVEQSAGLWVEGLPMIATGKQIDLPHPKFLELGLTVDDANKRLLSRFSSGTIFPIDVVAEQPMDEIWDRYLPILLTVGTLILLLIILWGFVVLHYSRQRFSLATELHDAVMNGQIKAKYQPIMNLHTNTCYGAESLARWVRESGEEISPNIFVPLVETAGLCTELTKLMLNEVLRELGEYLKTNPGYIININLSASHLEANHFMEYLAAQLAKTGVPAASVGLEITERGLIDSDDARQRISKLRQRGHRISIDDFGTGYSSLSYLEGFELDVLKVDKSFIDAIETHGVTSNVVAHIIEMAKSLKLDIVAEGVELEHQAQWLIKQNVKMVQGYLYSRPVPAEAFIDFALSKQMNSDNIVELHSVAV